MDADWDEYRRRRRAFWRALLLVPIWFVPGGLINRRLHDLGVHGSAGFLAALPLMVIIAGFYLRRILWRCPRCGRPFHFSPLYSNPFGRRCIHCGLPLWAPASRPSPSGSMAAADAADGKPETLLDDF